MSYLSGADTCTDWTRCLRNKILGEENEGRTDGHVFPLASLLDDQSAKNAG